EDADEGKGDEAGPRPLSRLPFPARGPRVPGRSGPPMPILSFRHLTESRKLQPRPVFGQGSGWSSTAFPGAGNPVFFHPFAGRVPRRVRLLPQNLPEIQVTQITSPDSAVDPVETGTHPAFTTSYPGAVMDSAARFPMPEPRVVLTEQEWRERAARHAERAEEFVRSARRPSARPVEGFLFTYYSHRPSQLRRWHPGPGVVLLGESARAEFGRWYRTTTVPGPSGAPVPGVELDVAAFVADRGRALRFVADLLSAVRARSANFGCFGLHEWAMVYRQSPEERRHALPLRL